MALGQVNLLLVKGTPLLLLGFFLARRSFRAVLGFTLGSALLVAVSLLIGGVNPWLDYLRALPNFAYGRDIPGLFSTGETCNFSPSGFLVRQFGSDRELVEVLAVGFARLAFAGAFLCAAYARSRRESCGTDWPVLYPSLGARTESLATSSSA